MGSCTASTPTSLLWVVGELYWLCCRASCTHLVVEIASVVVERSWSPTVTFRGKRLASSGLVRENYILIMLYINEERVRTFVVLPVCSQKIRKKKTYCPMQWAAVRTCREEIKVPPQ